MSKLNKAEILLMGASRDLDIGCFNKKIPASYPSVRFLFESLLPV